jgi:glycosyltransferase involved in cell wall biosynthesis
MNVLFVNYEDFTSNSAVHIFNLANELSGGGVSCAVAVPGDPATIGLLGEPRFQTLDFRQARKAAPGFADGGPPSLVHAWTPREAVRELTEELAARHDCPYVVHLEDNEDVLTANSLGVAIDELHGAVEVPPTLAHPRRMRQFLAGAAGMTAIVDRLLEFRPDGLPAEVVWPGFERDLFDGGEPEPALRRQLGIADAEAVLVYPGNTHPSNAAEVRSLYLAVAALNRAGYPVRLIRLGRDYVRFVEPELKKIEQHVVRVPLQPRSEVPRYLRLADVLVQPGRSGDFNDYRFPSKLPEFFATGRAVVLPATNLGRTLVDGEQCILLRSGDALEIVAAVERLLDDDQLRNRLGKAARTFAEEHFSWPASARKLRALYERVLDSTEPADGLRSVAERYASFHPPPIGYGTARDYSESVETLPQLACASHDLKDVQRPWALKAIVGTVPPGSRLLEIGAGEPVVADLLSRLGYDVTVVDPYDGRDGGPTGFDALRLRYPRLRLIRGLFPRSVPAGEHYDCVYSISVLEHIPLETVSDVCAGIRRVAAGGRTVHAIDHVLRGSGEAEHATRLRRIAAGVGAAEAELEAVLAELEDDPDTYFLSAESHNRWRGGVPYDEFPMRRCVSIQLSLPVSQ